MYRFKSMNYRNRYIRHRTFRNFDVWVDESIIHAQLYEKDSSFVIVPGKDGINLLIILEYNLSVKKKSAKSD